MPGPVVTKAPNGRYGVVFRTFYDFDWALKLSGQFNTGELTYYFLMRIDDTSEYCGAGCDMKKYAGTLYVVSPDYAGVRAIRTAMHAWGEAFDTTDRANEPVRDAVLECMADYGCAAPIVSYASNSKADVHRVLAREARACRSMFGFYLDRQVNACGDSGWDWMRGRINTRFARDETVADDKANTACIVAHVLAGVDVGEGLRRKYKLPEDDAPFESAEGHEQRAYIAKLLIRRWFANMAQSWGKPRKARALSAT